jgi:hypothetical protein
VTQLLDDRLLDELTRALHSAGLSTETWAPGLSDHEIDALLQPHSLDLPEEARRWWRWHNGYKEGTSPPWIGVTPNRPLLNLQQVLKLYAQTKDESRQIWGADRWLMVFVDRPSIYFVCNGPHDAPVPIRTQEDIDDPEPVLPSIGELVKTWTELLATTVLTTDADGKWKWEWDFDKIPQHIRELGVY